MRMDPQFQLLAATPPIAGQPASGPPNGLPAWTERLTHMPPSAQQAESQRAQQQYLRRQQAEVVAMMTRDRVDLPHADWTPPWDFVPPAYASPGNQDRLPYMPAFMAHPLYSGMPSAGQPAAQMDSATFPDYHAEVENIPRVGGRPSNAYVMEMADEFFRAH